MLRRALRRPDEKRATVTEIAADYGFWEFGRFLLRTARSVNHLLQRCVVRLTPATLANAIELA